MRYQAHLTAGALKVPESRILSSLLLRGLGPDEWKHALETENVLQVRNPRTARRIGGMIRGRLETMTPPLWRLIRDGSRPVATHACLAATIQHSRLLGDFLDLMVREQMRLYEPKLRRTLWEPYLEDCRSRDPELPRWSQATSDRLRSSVLTILAEAGYIRSARNPELQRVLIAQPVLDYLESHDERYVLRCLLVD